MVAFSASIKLAYIYRKKKKTALRFLTYLYSIDLANRQTLRENGIFEPFIYKNDRFAKTGSGQT